MFSLGATTPASQQEAAEQCQQIWLPIVNRHIDETDLFHFYIFILFCAPIATTKKSMRNKIFLIVVKNGSLLAAIYVCDDFAANWRRQML